VVINRGTIRGTVSLGPGNDVFIGTGGAAANVDGDDGNDRLVGGSNADHLFGSEGNDRLIGGAGNDRLDGGLGVDTLPGGPGRDHFVFDTGLTNVDVITDFQVNVDKIELSLPGLGRPGLLLAAAKFHIGAAAADASDRIIYNPNSGFLFYDG